MKRKALPQVSANRERKFENEAVAFCLYRAASTVKELGESMPVLRPKRRILEHIFLNVSPNKGPVLLSPKNALTEAYKGRETEKRTFLTSLAFMLVSSYL